MTEAPIDRTFEAFKCLVSYLRGSLWWGANDFIKKHEPSFNQSDTHRGHPLLSLRKEPVERRSDAIPMLMGTSGAFMRPNEKRRCIVVKGMTRNAPKHITYFGSIIEPALYSAEDMVDGSTAKAGEYDVCGKKNNGQDGRKCGVLRRASWTEYHRMIPNWDKPMVDKSEMAMVDDYCLIHQL